jgi:hypothetical protein
MSFHKILRDSIVEQFGSEIKAGLHSKYPRLKELWLDAEAERAERDAMRQACWEVANDADTNWLQDKQ